MNTMYVSGFGGKRAVEPHEPLVLIFPGLVSAVGAILLIYSVYLGWHAQEFESAGIRAPATVHSVERIPGKKKDKYVADLGFLDRSGQEFHIKRPASSNWKQGETKEIIYLADFPLGARLNTFSELWGSALAACIFGAVGLIGGLFWLRRTINRRKEVVWLIAHGQHVQAKVISIDEFNTRTKRGRRRRYRVVAIWRKPGTADTWKFESQKLRHHPGEDLLGAEIDVLIDPANPDRYYLPGSSL